VGLQIENSRKQLATEVQSKAGFEIGQNKGIDFEEIFSSMVKKSSNQVVLG